MPIDGHIDVHTYRWTDILTNRHTYRLDRQTHLQVRQTDTDSQTYPQIDRYTHR